MLVSFSVANHGAEPVKMDRSMRDGLTATGILSRSCADSYKKAAQVLQSSLTDASEISESTDAGGTQRDLRTKIPHLIPAQNGFVDTVILGYTKHHALVLRPDDLLPAAFVQHQGKRELVVVDYTLDFGSMSRQMAGVIEKNVVDPALRKWVLPDFSTTTVNDTTVSAVLMMATLKKYFTYSFIGGCGLPRVTLQEARLGGYIGPVGEIEGVRYLHHRLVPPVISRFVAAFDAPETPENIDFWQKVAHYEAGGSEQGPSYYSGWITAFYVFSEKRIWIGNRLDTTASSATAPETLSAKQFWVTYAKPSQQQFPKSPAEKLVLDDTSYHFVREYDMPPGCAEVDVKVTDRLGRQSDCIMTAGIIGTKVFSSGDKTLSASGKYDSVLPASGWWMFEKKPDMSGMTTIEDTRLAIRMRVSVVHIR